MNLKDIKDKGKLFLLLALGVAGAIVMIFCGNGTKEETQTYSETEYEAALQKRLCELCNSVRGVSECELSITFSRGFVYEYSSRGAVIGVHYPAAQGAAVVCKGGDSAVIKKELTDLLSAVLNISSSQISVSGK